MLLIVTFFVLLNISSKISSKILFTKNKILVCNEVDEKYINKTYENNYNLHEYCLDLDIVGKNSLLAYLDKTQSKSAFIKLEHDLLNVTIEKDKITEKQNAIQELASKIEWCIQYLTTAKKNESNYTLIVKQGKVIDIDYWEKLCSTYKDDFAEFNTQ